MMHGALPRVEFRVETGSTGVSRLEHFVASGQSDARYWHVEEWMWESEMQETSLEILLVYAQPIA